MPRRFPYKRGKEYFEGIPNVAEWKKLTQITTLFFTHSRSNPLLLDIDAAIANFDQSESAPFNRASETAVAIKTKERITALLLLEMAKKSCLWLESKAGEEKSVRRKYVANLLMEAQKAIATIDLKLDEGRASLRAGKQSALYAGMAARLRWKMSLESIKQIGVGKGLKTLDSPYWAETNVSGVNPHHLQGAELQHEWSQQHTPVKDKFLFNFTRRRVQEKGTEGAVKYVGPEARWRYQILFDGQGKMYRRSNKTSTDTSQDALIDTTGVAWIFIIDKDGNCYASFGETPEDGKKFHHSTIMSGSSVILAGAIRVDKGVLKEIDNASGHYKPKKDNLLNGLAVLQKYKVPLAGVQLTYFAGMKQVEGEELPMFEIYLDADKFLKAKGTNKPDMKSSP
ncbi:MAG: hypothetical protein ABFD82_22920 [Syntrophaceae bacterium]